MDTLEKYIIWAYNDGKTRKWESGDDYYEEVFKSRLTPQFNWVKSDLGDEYICELSDFTLSITEYKNVYDAEIFLFGNMDCIFRQEDIATIEEAKLVLEIEFLKYWKKWTNEIFSHE